MPDPVGFYCPGIFDGEKLHRDRLLITENGICQSIVARENCPPDIRIETFDDGMIGPGFVDLQVNGGGGVMFNHAPDQESLARISSAHLRLGATSILPTLISDTPEVTREAARAVVGALQDNMPGIIGLHLEGPHLSKEKKGAHDGKLLRPMSDADLAFLLELKKSIPILKLTFSPDQVTDKQIRVLSGAGLILSLGHTPATANDCRAAIEAGASCVTHLYNAMSQLTARDPGLVGEVLSQTGVNAGLIADGIHVDDRSMAIALRIKKGPGRIFLVSDSMATAGSDLNSFQLNDRTILRHENRLTLADGTLAGAHLALIDAVTRISRIMDCPFHEAYAMASSVPADVAGAGASIGYLKAGYPADFVLTGDDGLLQQVYRRAIKVD